MREHISKAFGLQRLFYGLVAGLGFGLIPWPVDTVARALMGWSFGAAFYLLLAWWLAEVYDAYEAIQASGGMDMDIRVLKQRVGH